jgi:hypothetical protein
VPGLPDFGWVWYFGSFRDPSLSPLQGEKRGERFFREFGRIGGEKPSRWIEACIRGFFEMKIAKKVHGQT